MSEIFDCNCVKCGNSFKSEDAADFDGQAFCSVCKEKNKEVAAKVDAIIAARRANKGDRETVNPYLDIRNNPKKRNKSTINYMNVPR